MASVRDLNFMNVSNPEKRLVGGWGIVDSYHNAEILKYAVGNRLLDVGCGYGSLVEAARLKGFTSMGIDPDLTTLDVTRTIYPNSKYLVMKVEDVEELGFKFDTVILRDSLHHLIYEGDFQKSLKAITNVLEKGSRVIVFDPNLNLPLKLARRLVRHQDFSCSDLEARDYFLDLGLKLILHRYYEVFGVAVTGGYVGPALIKNSNRISKLFAYLNNLASIFFNYLGLGRQFCWRYILVFERAN